MRGVLVLKNRQKQNMVHKNTHSSLRQYELDQVQRD